MRAHGCVWWVHEGCTWRVIEEGCRTNRGSISAGELLRRSVERTVTQQRRWRRTAAMHRQRLHGSGAELAAAGRNGTLLGAGRRWLQKEKVLKFGTLLRLSGLDPRLQDAPFGDPRRAAAHSSAGGAMGDGDSGFPNWFAPS